MNMLALSSEGVGYILGTFTVPFILGWIVTKRWYYGMAIAAAWMFFKFGTQPKPQPEPMSKQLPDASLFATP